MKYSVLLTATQKHVATLTGWGMGIMTGLLILRAANDFMQVYADSDADVTFREALKKVRKRIYAVLIALTIDSTVAYIRHFYM